MTTIVICEKPSQGRNIEAALGNKYGDILPCQGHLLRLEEPEEVNPDWKRWNLDLLVPPKGRYGFMPDPQDGKGPRLTKIKSALRGATQVIIATDCDREGQGIGQSVLEFLGFRGSVKRAIFTAEDPTALTKAFSAAEPNANFQKLYNSWVARSQADQIYNLTLTRVATTVLREPYTKGVIGVGRVKSPTLGILCRREKEIQNFKSTEYFEILLTVKGASGLADLKYAPPEDKRLVVRGTADAIAAVAKTYHGPISVKTERKKSAPPRPYDLPALQQRANTLWGWSASRTDKIAQELYEDIKITTYPRAESQYLPETMIPTVGPLVDQLRRVADYTKLPIGTPNIRKGADGVFSDKKLEGMSHHAIIPNVNCPGGIAAGATKLSPDQAKLFDIIARRFLAAVNENYIYDQTTLSVLVDVPAVAPGKPFKFSTSGSVPVELGWRAIDDEVDPDKPVTLPKLKDGEIVDAQKAEVKSKWTEPPKRYTEAGLIKAMQEAWKFVPDPEEQARLKEAKGLGTPATRSSIIETLKRQKQIVLDAKNLVPTTAGMLLYDAFMDAAPIIVDPGATARMEARLDDILTGKATADDVIKEISALADTALRRIQQSTFRVNLEKATSFRKATGGAPSAAAARPRTAGSGAPASRASSPTRPPAARPSGSGTPARTASAPRSAAPSGSARPAAPRVPAPAAAGSADRIWLNVPSSGQRDAYSLKARWDAATSRWWIPVTADPTPFKQRGWIS